MQIGLLLLAIMQFVCCPDDAELLSVVDFGMDDVRLSIIIWDNGSFIHELAQFLNCQWFCYSGLLFFLAP